jgi:hypothetical protein
MSDNLTAKQVAQLAIEYSYRNTDCAAVVAMRPGLVYHSSVIVPVGGKVSFFWELNSDGFQTIIIMFDSTNYEVEDMSYAANCSTHLDCNVWGSKEVLVHKGFKDKLDLIDAVTPHSSSTTRGNIHDRFHDICHEIGDIGLVPPVYVKRLWIAGHSQGGSLALLQAYSRCIKYLTLIGNIYAKVVCVGSPPTISDDPSALNGVSPAYRPEVFEFKSELQLGKVFLSDIVYDLPIMGLHHIGVTEVVNPMVSISLLEPILLHGRVGLVKAKMIMHQGATYRSVNWS